LAPHPSFIWRLLSIATELRAGRSAFWWWREATSNSLISQYRHRSSKTYYGFLDSELFDSLSRFANCLWATACREMWGSVPPPSRLHGSPATAPQVGHETSKTLLCMTKGYCSLPCRAEFFPEKGNEFGAGSRPCGRGSLSAYPAKQPS
jgi:hypothetical protein